MISKENVTIIRALNTFGRVPEQHELLDEIERLQQELQRKDNNWNELKEWLTNESEKLHQICGDNWTTVGQVVYNDVLDKIKEVESK